MTNDKKEIRSFETRTLDRTTISQLGEALGVDKLLMIYVVPSGRKLHMATIRLVDVKTAKVLTSTTVITPATGQDADIIMKQISIDIADVINNSERIVRNKLLDVTLPNEATPTNVLRRTGDELQR